MSTSRSNEQGPARRPIDARVKTPSKARGLSRRPRRRRESSLSIVLPAGAVLAVLILVLAAWIHHERQAVASPKPLCAPAGSEVQPAAPGTDVVRAPMDDARSRAKASTGAPTPAEVRVVVEPESSPKEDPLVDQVAAEAPVTAPGPLRAAADVDAVLARAEEAAKRRRYGAAADEARRVLDQLATDDAARPAIEGRANDLIDLSRLFAELLAAIPAMSDRSWPIAKALAGTIEGAAEDRLDVMVGAARTGVAWADVPAERMLDLFRRAGARDAYALAVFCLDNGLEVEGSRELDRFVTREPDQASRAFGLVARVRGMAVPSDGFVFHVGRWLTRTERELAVLTTRVESLADRIRMGTDDEAASAVEELEEVLAGPEKRSGFAQETRVLRASSLDARRDALVERLGRLPAMAQIERMMSLKRELNAARAEALRVIFDKNIYPDEDHGRRGQPAVDKRVRQLRELWEQPAVTLPGSPKPIHETLKSLLALEGLVGQCEGMGRRDGEWRRLLSMLDRPVSVRTVALDEREQEVIDHNRKVEAYNAGLEAIMTPEERRVVELVNGYREMLGLKILEHDGALATAARAHSKDMEDRGFFAHENPDGKSPSDRCRESGYPSLLVGENIAVRAYTAEEAHDGWYRSSGHHRNMLDAGYTQMGCGRSGGHWTEDFGAAPGKAK